LPVVKITVFGLA